MCSLPFPAIHELAPRQWRHASLDFQVSALCSINAMQEACNDTYLPITYPGNVEVRAFVAGLPAEEQAGLTNEEAMERANERLRDHRARTIPITANLVALIFVSLSDLAQDQRQVLDMTDGQAPPGRLPPERASRSSAPQRLPSIIVSSPLWTRWPTWTIKKAIGSLGRR